MSDYLTWRNSKSLGPSNICTYADTDGIYAKYICKDEQIAKDLKEENMIRIKKVIFNDPVTVVIWEDKTKTIVRARNEPFDPEKGLAMAIAKRALGNKGNYYNVFNKWIPKEKNNERK